MQREAQDTRDRAIGRHFAAPRERVFRVGVSPCRGCAGSGVYICDCR
ncbi:hypothetical protein SAMN05216229_12426 [Geopseudomonas sagittaria]|uniref:Uncharacterized protein n=1 Tax=Geopseudomonas sagittaria TaxID=1135990 RepID=A0A1I5YVS0_9GAMM|nr:hypothetical protein SAMN05216229_12426 [Pseudomonas sagittaria]